MKRHRMIFNLDLVAIFRSVGMDKEADMIEDGRLVIRPANDSKPRITADETGRLNLEDQP